MDWKKGGVIRVEVEAVHHCRGKKTELDKLSNGKGVLLQLLLVEKPRLKHNQNPEFDVLLQEFKRVFEEPTGLPPSRHYDHKLCSRKEPPLFPLDRTIIHFTKSLKLKK